MKFCNVHLIFICHVGGNVVWEKLLYYQHIVAAVYARTDCVVTVPRILLVDGNLDVPFLFVCKSEGVSGFFAAKRRFCHHG